MSVFRGRYRTRAVGDAEARAAMTERARRLGDVERTDGADALRADAPHVLVEDVARGEVVCCYRLTGCPDAGGARRSFALRFCDPEALARFDAPLIEIGRFCVEAGLDDPDVRRVAWSALRDHLDRPGIGTLFGGAGFAGARWEPFHYVFATLLAAHPESGRVDDGRPLRMPPALLTWLGIDARPAARRVRTPATPSNGVRRARDRAELGV